MDVRKREAMNATRTAFGADYEANLRMEAGPNPEKLARRKHQISSLYHQAKMKVLIQLCSLPALHLSGAHTHTHVHIGCGNPRP